MQTSDLARRGGLAAVIGGTIGLLYAPFYALAFFATSEGASSQAKAWLPWHKAARPVLEPFLTFASPDVVYLTYGKASLLMCLGWLAGTVALHGRQVRRAGSFEKWSFRIVVAGLSWFTAGTVGTYYVGTVIPAAVDVSFWAFDMPGLFLTLIGWPLFGIGTLRAGVAPRPSAWLLTFAGFPGIIVLAFVFGQLAMGLLLLNITWIGLGYALWSQRMPVVRPAPAAETTLAGHG